ncbi:glycosyltransferase family 2 protein [Paraburkholderia adhaesiva]|uniref:glycosyltransferase family 2 protein n=1 Tax=Paraburkholderia adhaesiva TaxID=2883244 RepID=UPI001F1FB51B|nr:glycosyltransferase [Paraburkholderia adhaesiva]
MIIHRLDKEIDALRVAVVTPTFERSRFLAQTWKYFSYQQHPFAALRWFVFDDSAQPQENGFLHTDPRVEYMWTPYRVPLGGKRNTLNEKARAWGADIICSMDDDDWYGRSYLADMARLLLVHEGVFAGSGEDYYLFLKEWCVLRVLAVKPGTSCNGVLCYKAAVLDTRAYDGLARSGEERAFICNDFVAQHPDVSRIHLALAHSSNTVRKRGYLLNPALGTSMRLDDFPMDPEDIDFYSGLACADLRGSVARPL